MYYLSKKCFFFKEKKKTQQLKEHSECSEAYICGQSYFQLCNRELCESGQVSASLPSWFLALSHSYAGADLRTHVPLLCI